ncbi:MAG: zf-HC2 domain-containing protein [Planctomycetota bacterium]|jgi:anti-sigma factor RsiW
MNAPGCDEIRMAVLARMDGEAAGPDAAACAEHIAACPTCRQELAAQEALSQLLAAHTRRSQEVDLWSAVCEQLEPQPRATRAGDQPIAAVAVVGGILLLAYKILELTPALALGLVVKLTPVLLAVLVFAWLRTNPFKVALEPSPAWRGE